MNTPKDQQSQNNENECSDIWTYLAESADSPWLPSNLGEYKQLSLLKSTPMHSEFSDTTSQISPSTQISETTTQSQENSTSLQWDSPAQVQVTQEAKQDSNIQLPHSGEKDLEYCSKLNPSSVLWNSLKDLSEEDLELFLPPSIWQDTVLRLRQSRRRSLGQDTKDSEFLSFPTLTSNECSTSRPAGQTKCEKWFKDKGLIPSGYQLGTRAIALMMGFPSNWFEGLTEQYSKNLNTQNQVKPQEESEQDTWQEEPLHQPKQRSLLEEFSISIPCLIKQPKQPELKGVIKEDLGDRFVVYIPDSDSTVTVSKLFVYPDLKKLDKSSRKNIHSSKNCSRKSRRKKGEGSGAIFYRTVTKNGRDYQEAYYHWRENGKQKSKYIPKKLLDKVKQAESLKLPVSDILVLLVGTDKCSRKKSDTSIISSDTKVIDSEDKCSRKTIPTSKKRRQKGYGSGWIQCKPIKRSGKEYKQYWYCYEEWQKGDRLTKKSRYIPKRLLARVEKMEGEKIPVREILEVLGVKR